MPRVDVGPTLEKGTDRGSILAFGGVGKTRICGGRDDRRQEDRQSGEHGEVPSDIAGFVMFSHCVGRPTPMHTIAVRRVLVEGAA